MGGHGIGDNRWRATRDDAMNPMSIALQHPALACAVYFIFRG
jgi:hypothetical protein